MRTEPTQELLLPGPWHAHLRWRHWPWAVKLALLLGGLALVPLTAVTLFNSAVTRAKLLADTQDQDLQQARDTAHMLDDLLDDIRSDLQLVEATPQTARFLAASRPDGRLTLDVAATLLHVRNSQGFDAVYLADSSGRVRLATDARFTGRNYLSAPYFLNAAAGNVTIDEPRWDPTDGRVYLHFAIPVREPQGRIVGVAVGRVRMERIDALIQGDTGFAGRGEFGILWDADGIRLSHPTKPALRFHPFEPLRDDAATHLIAEQRLGPATSRFLATPSPAPGLLKRSRWLLYEPAADPFLRLDFPGRPPVHAAVVPLRSTRWLYGIFSPEEKIFASVREQTRRNLLFAVLTAVFAVALAMAAASWATRPLRLMGQTARALARGDMSRRVGPEIGIGRGRERGDEVGRLAFAFDAMADTLAAKEAELRAYAGGLEQRVEEQTAALRRSEAELRELFEREQEARHKAEEANRIKDDFLSTVSHELRTPLNAILGWVWLLSNGTLSPEETRRAIATIERNARAQGQIVDDLLDVSRIITGKLRLQVIQVNLVQIIEAALDSVGPAAAAKEIQVERRLDPLAALATGDPNRLQQVVWNLLSNAVKFTPQGGTVEVGLARQGSYAEIRVRDTGAGISADFLQHVFDRFRQADSSSTRAHGGLGLGLAIVRHLVELHGGTVEAESAGEGKGATFTVRLPVAPELRLAPVQALRERSMAPAALAAGDLQGLKILLVDDEPDAREVLPALLERFGAEVQVAASTREALVLLPRFVPDVLVSDLAMPGEDGYSLIRQVRKLEDGLKDLPAIALTAQASDVDRARALAAGFQIHLAKPVEPRDLVAAVTTLTRDAPSPP
jgi:signal transduction histidine kinase/ActR/RegA family two-component response regulator